MDKKRRVVITGLGAVSPIGNSPEEMWENIEKGYCGIAEITRYDTSDQKAKLAGEVKDLNAEQYIAKREIRKMDAYSVYAMCAAVQAMQNAGLDQSPEEQTESRDRWGVSMASGIGGISTIETEHSKGLEKGFDRVSPFFIPMSIANMAAGNIAIRFGMKGKTTAVVTACASAGNAIGDAFHYIRDGYSELMLAGGAEMALTPLCMGGFTALKALSLSTDPSRASIPFDADRNGFVMGEGAGALVLEELEHAKNRGAVIYGEIAGYGANCDAYHITAPSPNGEGAAQCMREAMQDAGIRPDQIDYINAHGTSTPMNDKCETAAVKAAFGDAAGHVKMSSTKSMTGHLLGASAAIESVISVLALQHDFLPPTINYRNPDPDCDLDIVPNKGYSFKLRYAMSNSFGFGGHNASLIFKKWEE